MDLKILSTGSNREIVDNITDYLKNNIEYDITKCENDSASISSSLTSLRPNVVILCLGTEDQDSVKLYDVIAKNSRAGALAVVVIASDEVFSLFMEHTALSDIQFVPRPVSRSSIFYKLEDIKEMFDTGELSGETPGGARDTAALTECESAGSADTKAFPGTGAGDAGGTSGMHVCGTVPSADTKEDPAPAPFSKRKRILIVDDDAEQLAHIKGALQEYYQVTAVRSGPAAFQFLEKHGTDLILLDYVMPGMDGPAVLTQLRADPSRKDIPIVFLTGVSEKETIIRTVVRLKPQGYLVKPAKKSEIIAKIIDILG